MKKRIKKEYEWMNVLEDFINDRMRESDDIDKELILECAKDDHDSISTEIKKTLEELNITKFKLDNISFLEFDSTNLFHGCGHYSFELTVTEEEHAKFAKEIGWEDEEEEE